MSNLDALWGAGNLGMLFGDHADKVVCPFPRAGVLKRPDPAHPEPDLGGPVYLSRIDPRDLWASQSWVLREHAEYYRTGEWERTGVTSADQDRESNWYPLVVTDHLGRKVIKAGHHRATVALIEGRPLLARVFPDTKDPAAAVLPRLLWGWTSRLPHLRCRSAGECVTAIREGRIAVCEDPVQVALAAIAMNWSVDRRRLPNPSGEAGAMERTVGRMGDNLPRDATEGFRLCTTCGGLRADRCPLSSTCEDHCSCERIERPAGETGEQRERHVRCKLCQICGLSVVSGHHRWRRVICPNCLPRARAFNTRAGRMVILPGIHSIVNGGPSLQGRPDGPTEEEFASFSSSLNSMFAGVSTFGEWARAMLLHRLGRLGLEPGQAVPLEDYLRRCRAAGIDADDGWQRLVAHLLGHDAPSIGLESGLGSGQEASDHGRRGW